MFLGLSNGVRSCFEVTKRQLRVRVDTSVSRSYELGPGVQVRLSKMDLSSTDEKPRPLGCCLP